MIQNYAFRRSLASGASGASQVIAILLENPLTVEVRDVQDDKEFQARGIDLVWVRRTKDGGTKEVTFDVKWDSYKSLNFAFEMVSVIEKKKPGCFLASEADFWVYGFPAKGEMYLLPMKNLREWYINSVKDGRRFPLKTTSTRAGNNTWHTLVALVPIKEVMQNLQVGLVKKRAKPESEKLIA